MEKVQVAFDLAHLFTGTWWAQERKQKLKRWEGGKEGRRTIPYAKQMLERKLLVIPAHGGGWSTCRSPKTRFPGLYML